MRIGDLSQRTGVPAHLLRYYEAQGLLSPSRSSNGYRDYSDEAAITVAQIRGLLDAGLSSEDIRLLLPCASGAVPDLEPCPELLATLRGRIRSLDKRIEALTHSRHALHRYLDAADAHARTPGNGTSHGTARTQPGTATEP